MVSSSLPKGPRPSLGPTDRRAGVFAGPWGTRSLNPPSPLRGEGGEGVFQPPPPHARRGLLRVCRGRAHRPWRLCTGVQGPQESGEEALAPLGGVADMRVGCVRAGAEGVGEPARERYPCGQVLACVRALRCALALMSWPCLCTCVLAQVVYLLLCAVV